jgi:hypothetical protein
LGVYFDRRGDIIRRNHANRDAAADDDEKKKRITYMLGQGATASSPSADWDDLGNGMEDLQDVARSLKPTM